MLLSLKSGNAGITLTRANYVFHFDLWWNPAISSQAAGRAHRIGQNKTVFETMLLAENTIERRIFDILETKKSLFNAVVDDLSEEVNLDKLMSEEELFGLFGLQKRRPKPISISASTANDMHLMDEDSFGNLAGELFSQMGYHLKSVVKLETGGIDINAKKITPTGIDEVVFRCVKLENDESLVDANRVSDFFKLNFLNKKIAKLYFVTNGKFSEESAVLAQNSRFELIDGNKLIGYIQIYFSK
jgi:acetolactate synthase small subunit